MAKQRDKAKTPANRKRFRNRYGKRRGSAGGRSETRYYPHYGDNTDRINRELHNLICRTPATEWGVEYDKAGKRKDRD